MELGITCETVLAKDVCEKLRKVAQDLKIKVRVFHSIHVFIEFFSDGVAIHSAFTMLGDDYLFFYIVCIGR